jgi:hypothetical protein
MNKAKLSEMMRNTKELATRNVFGGMRGMDFHGMKQSVFNQMIDGLEHALVKELNLDGTDSNKPKGATLSVELIEKGDNYSIVKASDSYTSTLAGNDVMLVVPASKLIEL